MKAGPNTVNYDDVETIKTKFTKIKNLARQNSRQLNIDDLVIGVLYGTPDNLNAFYKALAQDFPIYVGEDFWYRFTGDKNFYLELVERFSKVALETDAKELLDNVINTLSKEIQDNLLNKELKKKS